MFLHVSVNKQLLGSLLLSFAKAKHCSKLTGDGLLTETCRSILM
jgi:hypothetical protein